MTSLQELTSQLEGVKRAFDLSTPQTDTCLRFMDETISVLEDLRREVLTHVNAMSSTVQFERLRGILTTMADLVYEIIVTLGDVDRDFTPIECAAKLVDKLALHIRLSQNVTSLAERSQPIQEDLSPLGPSMEDIRTLLGNFHSSTREVFARLRNEMT
jgi:hypothetical protein